MNEWTCHIYVYSTEKYILILKIKRKRRQKLLFSFCTVPVWWFVVCTVPVWWFVVCTVTVWWFVLCTVTVWCFVLCTVTVWWFVLCTVTVWWFVLCTVTVWWFLLCTVTVWWLEFVSWNLTLCLWSMIRLCCSIQYMCISGCLIVKLGIVCTSTIIFTKFCPPNCVRYYCLAVFQAVSNNAQGHENLFTWLEYLS